jgi:hypothetical protein
MNKYVKEFAEQAKESVPAGLPVERWIETYNQNLAELIIKECSSVCGSQADKKNILKRFGLPVESNVKYSAPEQYGSVMSQYDREYNLPK